MKIINFVLPGGGSLKSSPNPVGGYKVVYEYANKFIKDGYSVNIIYPASILWKERSFKLKSRSIILYFYARLRKSRYEPYSWFDLNKKIKLYWIPSLEEKYIPNGDYIFATACETAEYVNKYSMKKGKKFYLIQHFEEWYFTKERLLNTWKMPMKNIVIASWLEKISNKLKLQSKLVENGLDFKEFGLDISFDKKIKKQISMLYHNSEWKGSKYGIEALDILKKKYPDLKVSLFGVPKKPQNLPMWINYYQNPSKLKLREIYNESSLHLGTSLGEGWGLTVCEAMMCGAAVVCTNVQGYTEFSHDRDTALLCESENSLDMANKLEKFINNDDLRIKIAKQGYNNIQKYTWEKAYNKLKKYMGE